MRRFSVSLSAAILVISITFALASCGRESAIARATVPLYGAPEAQELAVSETIVPDGEKLTIIERKDTWVKVRFADVEGWLPQWYLGRSSDSRSVAVVPRSLVVNRQANVLLSPETSAATITELGAGRVVQVLEEFGDFAYVRLIALSVPDVQRGWVEKTALSTPTEATPAEGLLRPGTVIRQGAPGTVDPWTLPTRQLDATLIVRILSRKGSMLYVISNGGWDGWVDAQDFVPDPFGQ